MIKTEPYALTEVQLAYVLGRSNNMFLGGNSTHFYVELDLACNIDELEVAFNKVIKEQSMLRTVIFDDGTQQEYDGDTTYKIAVTELVGKQKEEIDKAIEDYRLVAAQRMFPLNSWPMFALQAYHIEEGIYRIAMDFDMMVMDRFSIDLLMHRMFFYYNNLNEEIYTPKIDFRGYISKKAKYKEENYEADKKFWDVILDSMPGAPIIPYNHNVGVGGRFVYKERIFDNNNWQKQKEWLFEKRVVPSVYVLVCYAKMLSIWSNQQKLTINMTTAKRNIGKEIFGDVIGDFTQLMLIDFDFSKNYQSITEEILACCKETQKKLRKYLKHDSVSGIEVMKEYAKRNNLESGEGFLYAFTSRIADQETESFDGFIVNKGYQISQTPQLLLDCQISELDGRLYLRWDYVEEGIDTDTISEMFEAFCKYVEKCTDEATISVSYSKIDEIVDKYNDTSEDIEETTLQALFYKQQNKTPSAIAVVSGDEYLTYAMLQEKSSLVANEIISKYGRGKAVAVVAERCCGTIVNMLGVLKSGGYYIPISTDIPEERKKYILKSSDAVSILEPDFSSKINEKNIVEDAYIGIGTPNDIAYVIYTSGSTGIPKGVVINQKSVCNTIIDINQKVGMGIDDCIIGISSFVFDLSVYDIFGALSTGAKLVLAQSALDVDDLIEIIDNHNVTFWNTVPAIMELLATSLEGRKITSLKHVLLSGDWIPLDLPDKIKSIFTETEVISLGGATEGSIWSIYYPIGERQKNWKSIPYGYPLANQNMYVLNYENKNCPYNVQGEICIGGKGVAREYQASPEQTAKSFVMHDTYGYIYRTGDYGVFRREGYIEFLGRKDTQTKIHGFRVELGEIEAVLKRADFVKESVAQVITSATGVQRLLGYIVTSTGKTLNEEQKRCLYQILEMNLPHYMIPSDVYVIESIPLTSNGKVNKKALPIFADNIIELERKEAFTDTEKMVVNLVAETLGIEIPGINQDLFELGIDSMKCIQLLTHFKEKGYKISLSELYEQSNLERLASLLENKKDSILIDEKVFQIAPEDKWKPFRMTPLQEAYYVGRMQHKDKNALPTGGYIEIECKSYNHDKFEYCMQKLIARHEMLRCKFVDGGIQQFMETVPYFNVPLNDVRDALDKDAKIEEIRKRVSSSRLELDTPPLIAVEASLIENETAIIHIFMDGMIMDGWATELFVAELNNLYYKDMYMFEPVDVTFRDYVQYLNYKRETEEYKVDQEYWEKRIIELPESVSLPMIVEPETVEEMHSAQIPCWLNIEEWKLLEQKASMYRVTPFAVLFTSFIYVMSTWNYKKKFLLNIPEFDVPDFHKDYSKVIGLCSSFLLFSAEIAWEKSFADNVKEVQQQLIELKQHSNYSGMDVVRSMSRMQVGNSQGAICPYVFGMVMEAGNISGNKKDEKECFKLLYQENHTSNIWIDINTIKYEDKVVFNWNFINELFDRVMLQDMVNQQMRILNNAARVEEYWSKPVVYELPDSQKNIIDSVDNLEEIYSHKCMSVIFEDSCKENENREFICTQDGSYTYKEIYDKCRRVAGQLIQAGCKKGDHIAVYMGKSMEQLIAILSITYMGGVYVPLEYSYPIDLVTKCYNNTDCVCMITDEDKASDWKKNEINIVVPNLDYDAYILEKPVEVSLDDEFVIIHTSGSTGVPKAVIVNQKGLINSLLFTNKRFGVTKSDKAIALTNIAHDMSMYDIFGMLLVGGGIVIPLEKDAKNPIEWISLIEKYHVTIWNSVPAMQEMLQKVIYEKDITRLQSIRLFIHGGDYLKLPVAKWLYENYSNAKIINVGGPTETTLWNIFHIVTQEDIQKGVIPYGKPIANTRYYLLNENMQQVPIGVMGMMYCAGVGVTNGYYGNDKLTQEKYVINALTNERMYCTGDMGKYDKNGNIIFMGRIDNQVKINGKRIELNGIASVIMENKHIKECSVLEKDKEIIAFYTADKDDLEDELRKLVSEQMPLYMMPKFFVHVQEMIYMPNGKVNKNAMLTFVVEKKEISDNTTETYSVVEQKILELYKAQLGEDIDLDTDFYMLGGNSLMLLSMIGDLKETFNIEFDLSEMFGISTPREMAEYLESLM